MMTTVQTPTEILTIRVHLLQKNFIIASYAVGVGKRFKTGSKVYENVDKKSLKRCELEIFNEALKALGEGKKVAIEVEERFLQEFIKTNTIKFESYYQNIVDDIRTHLSLCTAISCKPFVSKHAFNAALEEYKKAKAKAIPDTAPTYKDLLAQSKQLREAQKYEQMVSNW